MESVGDGSETDAKCENELIVDFTVKKIFDPTSKPITN